MLAKISIKKIIISTATLFALFLIYIIPKDKINVLENVDQELIYTSKDIVTSTLYLLDSSNYLGRATALISSNEVDIEARAKELIEILIVDGKGESKVPNGFKAIIPSDTKILSIKFESGLIKINFSSELLKVQKEYEEKLVEAIVYTLTSIKEVDKVIIYVDGNILTQLPQTKKHLPSTLDRSYGINKEYNLTTYKDVNQVTVYYVNKYNDNYYYVPVTKYVNDNREKIKIVIDELTSSPIYNSNLMSFLDNNTKLLSVNTKEDVMQLEFNSAIFNDINNNEILEEVIYTICLSIGDNYPIKEVVFEVDKQEIFKTVLKTIE